MLAVLCVWQGGGCVVIGAVVTGVAIVAGALWWLVCGPGWRWIAPREAQPDTDERSDGAS